MPSRAPFAAVLAAGLLLLFATPAGAITRSSDATALANAALRDPSQLTSASWDVLATNSRAGAIATESLQGFPAQGSDYLVLSSGDAGLAPSASQGTAVNHPNASFTNGGGTRGGAKDVSVLRLNFTVPAGNNCMSLKFRYFSEEYPEFINQGYNDGFLAELDPTTAWTMASSEITAPANFAFMPGGEFVSINSAAMSAAAGAGTVYDGGTELLTASSPVTGGPHSLLLSVWDDGDTNYDSAAFVDDVYLWNAPPGGCVQGATSATPPADTTPPETTLTGTPSGTTDASATFGFSADEAGTFECRVDGGTWTTCTSANTVSALATGSHTFEVRATDTAGNADATPASFTWTVDATPPDTTILTGPSGTVASASADLTFGADEPSTFECQLDAGAWTACTTPGTYSALTDDAHTFSVRATDALGHVDATPATRSWSVDTAAPASPVVDVAAAPAPLSSDANPTVTFTGEAGATFECRLNSGAWTPCTSPLPLTGLSDGTQVLELRETDGVGNQSPARVYTWTVDTTGPAAPAIVAGPSGTVPVGPAPFALAGEPGTTFQCRVDGGPWATCATSFDLTGLAVGTHVLEARQIDVAGNVGAIATRRWTIAAHPAPPVTGDAPVLLTGSVGTPRRTGTTPIAVISGTTLPVGCSVGSGAIMSCTVEVYVDGKLVGTGTARYGGGTRSGRVNVQLTRELRARLADHSVKARFVFRATAVGGEPALESHRRAVLAASAQWILPSDGLFESGRARLVKQVRRYLRAIAPELRTARSIRVEGHTDSIGTTADNHRLGMRRAKAVCRELRRLGVDARLLAGSRGETRPRATNATAAGRWSNRRVELRVLR